MTLVGTGTPGSNVAPSENANAFFDLLAAKSVLLAAGAKQIRTDHHSLAVPRLTSDVVSAWVAEGDDITEDDPGLDTILATPRKVAALTSLSNEIVDDSVPGILAMVDDSMSRSLALRMDLGFFEGSGTAPVIRGLKNVSGIQSISMGTNGAALTNLDAIADALGLLDAANAGPRRAIFMAPRNWTTLSKVKEVSGSAKPVLTSTLDPAGAIRPSVYGVPVYTTSQISVTETQGSSSVANSIYVVDLDQTVVVIRNDLSVVMSTDFKFGSDQTVVRATARVDLVVPNPSGVVRIAGVL
jgi:HK97 family phage major capsid protein